MGDREGWGRLQEKGHQVRQAHARGSAVSLPARSLTPQNAAPPVALILAAEGQTFETYFESNKIAFKEYLQKKRLGPKNVHLTIRRFEDS